MRISYPTDDIYDRVILVKKMECVKTEGFLLACVGTSYVYYIISFLHSLYFYSIFFYFYFFNITQKYYN